MWTENFQIYKLDLEKAGKPVIQMANIHWIIEKAREFQKNIYFCFIDKVNLTVRMTTDCGKFLKWWEYQTTLTASWETYMQVKLEPDTKQ